MKLVPQALNIKDEEGNTFIMLLYLSVNTDPIIDNMKNIREKKYLFSMF